MSFRFGVAWLERLFLSTTTLDDDDAVAWLVGDDTSIVERRHARAREAIVSAGGDLG